MASPNLLVDLVRTVNASFPYVQFYKDLLAADGMHYRDKGVLAWCIGITSENPVFVGFSEECH